MCREPSGTFEQGARSKEQGVKPLLHAPCSQLHAYLFASARRTKTVFSMASPFRLFRKNVKPLLVVFGVLLIVAWVGGSSLTTLMSGSGDGGAANARRTANAVAASWEGG